MNLSPQIKIGWIKDICSPFMADPTYQLLPRYELSLFYSSTLFILVFVEMPFSQNYNLSPFSPGERIRPCITQIFTGGKDLNFSGKYSLLLELASNLCVVAY